LRQMAAAPRAMRARMISFFTVGFLTLPSPPLIRHACKSVTSHDSLASRMSALTVYAL